MKRLTDGRGKAVANVKRFSCSELVELVTAYLDDALGDAERHAFDEHTRACVSCSDEIERYRTTIGLLGGLPAEEPLAPAARARLLTAFRRSRRP